MSKKLALFPLSLVAYPGQALNLHIFEERYKELIHDCKENEMHFGIPSYTKSGGMSVGTEMRLEKIERIYPDGKMDIRTIGIRIFRLIDYKKVMEGKLYPCGEIEYLINDLDTDVLMVQKLKERLLELFQLMNITFNFPDDLKRLTSYSVAQKCGLILEQEIELLKISSEKERLLFLIQHLDILIPQVKAMELVRQKIQMNGHFRNVKPPEV